MTQETEIPVEVLVNARWAILKGGMNPDEYPTLCHLVQNLVLDERERCAKICEDHGHSNGRIRPVHRHLASAIRSGS